MNSHSKSRGRAFLWCILAAAVAIAVFAAVRTRRIPHNVAYVTEEDGGISVVDLRTLKVVRRVHPATDLTEGIEHRLQTVESVLRCAAYHIRWKIYRDGK